MLPFDLHVLGIPPAFILSQDQTLHVRICTEIILKLKLVNYSEASFLLSKNSDEDDCLKSFKLLICLGSGRFPEANLVSSA